MSSIPFELTADAGGWDSSNDTGRTTSVETMAILQDSAHGRFILPVFTFTCFMYI